MMSLCELKEKRANLLNSLKRIDFLIAEKIKEEELDLKILEQQQFKMRCKLSCLREKYNLHLKKMNESGIGTIYGEFGKEFAKLPENKGICSNCFDRYDAIDGICIVHTHRHCPVMKAEKEKFEKKIEETNQKLSDLEELINQKKSDNNK